MGFVDDSQLIQSFSQFSLMNANPNFGQQNAFDLYNIPAPNSVNSCDISLENNFSNYGGHLSSLPSYMTSSRMNRSHSINNRLPDCSSYMKENFLFDKIGEKISKDDTTIRINKNPITVEPLDSKPFQPLILKNHKIEIDALSNSSYSSKSSKISFNESGSCSSLEISFDGSGVPYMKPFRTSAFAKVKNNPTQDLSNSQDSDDYKNQEKEKPMEMEDSSNDNLKCQSKSSFFRLKNTRGGGN